MTAPAGPAVERQIAGDMIRRALPLAPVVVGVAALVWGGAGAASAALAVVLVLANFAAAAALLTWAAGISLTFLMVAALGGFLLRLALLTVAVVLVKGQPWMRLLPFALTMVGAHLGLLVWEVRHISASLAYPGLRPTRTTGGR